MGLFDALFGKKTPLPPAADPVDDPNLIRVYDGYGRELSMTKADWRAKVLPGSIESHWGDPDRLYEVILGALADGFRPDIIDAARHLYEIDRQPLRGACIWGIVLMEENRLDEAEKVFTDFEAAHGENGVIQTNLAKVHARRKDDARAEQILWHGLELDPNQDNALGWYAAIHRERGGQDAELTALRRIAAVPRSWRAQAWLAKAALPQDLDQALALYRDSLARAGTPSPADLLTKISGDLGMAGHVSEIPRLIRPRFDASAHGLEVGNNLIKAYFDLGDLDAAREILDQLFALERVDWKGHLGYWDTELAKARISKTPVDPRELKMNMMTCQGPVWLKPESPASALFGDKLAGAPIVWFLGSSAEVAGAEKIKVQLADDPGRMSRALPLFLSEQVELRSLTRAQTLVPWISEPSTGFVLSGGRWRDEDAVNYSRQAGGAGGFVVVSHLKTRQDPWLAEIRLLRVSDGSCIGRLEESFTAADPADGLVRLAEALLTLLAGSAKIELRPPPADYTLPAPGDFPFYLLRLEQLLAVRCAAMREAHAGFLSGEREIIEGNLQLCLSAPGSVNFRILLAQTVSAMKIVRPDIIPEFEIRLAMLQSEHPLKEPAREVVRRLFDGL
jgi:tetratricopeptide (TPR) repeat protein